MGGTYFWTNNDQLAITYKSFHLIPALPAVLSPFCHLPDALTVFKCQVGEKFFSRPIYSIYCHLIIILPKGISLIFGSPNHHSAISFSPVSYYTNHIYPEIWSFFLAVPFKLISISNLT
jgi:hypothetical protein